MPSSTKLFRLLAEAKRLAKHYYHLTGRPLGVRIELREVEEADEAGTDAAARARPGNEESVIERIKDAFDAEDLSEEPAPEDVPERSA